MQYTASGCFVVVVCVCCILLCSFEKVAKRVGHKKIPKKMCFVKRERKLRRIKKLFIQEVIIGEQVGNNTSPKLECYSLSLVKLPYQRGNHNLSKILHVHDKTTEDIETHFPLQSEPVLFVVYRYINHRLQ